MFPQSDKILNPQSFRQSYVSCSLGVVIRGSERRVKSENGQKNIYLILKESNYNKESLRVLHYVRKLRRFKIKSQFNIWMIRLRGRHLHFDTATHRPFCERGARIS